MENLKRRNQNPSKHFDFMQHLNPNVDANNETEQKSASNAKKLFIIILLVSAICIFTILYQKENIVSFSYLRFGHPKHENWNENDLLTKVEYIAFNKIKGPESIVFNETSGSLYTGLRNGVIVRIDNDSHIEKIVQVGDELDERICDNVNEDFLAQPPCGRPFGLRLKPNSSYLYVADSFYGIVKVDVNNFKKKIVLSQNDTRLGPKPLKSTEDLDLDNENDLIYFVDSSYAHDVHEAVRWHEVNEDEENAPSGRLFRYNERTDKLDLLLKNLYYPNGVVLTPNKDALLINEFSMARILKYHLTGPKKGKKEVLINLPGFSDAIRLTKHNTLLVPFVAVFPKSQTLLGFFGRFPVFRSIIGLLYTPLKIISMLPSHGLVAEYDLNGNLLRTWHDPTGKRIQKITNAVLYNNKLYLGSYTNNFIGVVNYK